MNRLTWSKKSHALALALIGFGVAISASSRAPGAHAQSILLPPIAGAAVEDAVPPTARDRAFRVHVTDENGQRVDGASVYITELQGALPRDVAVGKTTADGTVMFLLPDEQTISARALYNAALPPTGSTRYADYKIQVEFVDPLSTAVPPIKVGAKISTLAFVDNENLLRQELAGDGRSTEFESVMSVLVGNRIVDVDVQLNPLVPATMDPTVVTMVPADLTAQTGRATDVTGSPSKDATPAMVTAAESAATDTLRPDAITAMQSLENCPGSIPIGQGRENRVGGKVWMDFDDDGLQDDDEPGFPGAIVRLTRNGGESTQRCRTTSSGVYLFDVTETNSRYQLSIEPLELPTMRLTRRLSDDDSFSEDDSDFSVESQSTRIFELPPRSSEFSDHFDAGITQGGPMTGQSCANRIGHFDLGDKIIKAEYETVHLPPEPYEAVASATYTFHKKTAARFSIGTDIAGGLIGASYLAEFSDAHQSVLAFPFPNPSPSGMYKIIVDTPVHVTLSYFLCSITANPGSMFVWRQYAIERVPNSTIGHVAEARPNEFASPAPDDWAAIEALGRGQFDRFNQGNREESWSRGEGYTVSVSFQSPEIKNVQVAASFENQNENTTEFKLTFEPDAWMPPYDLQNIYRYKQPAQLNSIDGGGPRLYTGFRTTNNLPPQTCTLMIESPDFEYFPNLEPNPGPNNAPRPRIVVGRTWGKIVLRTTSEDDPRAQELSCPTCASLTVTDHHTFTYEPAEDGVDWYDVRYNDMALHGNVTFEGNSLLPAETEHFTCDPRAFASGSRLSRTAPKVNLDLSRGSFFHLSVDPGNPLRRGYWSEFWHFDPPSFSQARAEAFLEDTKVFAAVPTDFHSIDLLVMAQLRGPAGTVSYPMTRRINLHDPDLAAALQPCMQPQP